MQISKILNDNNINIFLKNKYITKFHLPVGHHWKYPNSNSKITEDVYETGVIDTNITTKKDLEIFMKDFLKSPLRNIDITINHQLKYSMRGSGFTVDEITVNGIKNYDLRY
jgi:hypothetical protein